MKNLLGIRMESFHRGWLAHQAAGDATLVLAPRGHGKSTVLNVGYVLWRTFRDPDERVLVVSATGLQAQGFLREMRSHVETNRMLLEIFGDRRGEIWREREFDLAGKKRLSKEATVTAIGVEGAIISRHYDTIILDDVVDEESARTKKSRDRLEDWFYKVLVPCLEPGGRMHLIGTRYHPDDLYGRLIANAEKVEFLN